MEVTAPPNGMMGAPAEDTATSAEGKIVARRAGLIAVGTLVSRLLGAGRDMVIAATFTVTFTDAFLLAFTIPNALRVLLGEGAVSGAFVPVLTKVRTERGPEAARVFFGRLAGAMGLLLLLVSIAGTLGAHWLVSLYASGFREDPEQFARAVSLARMIFPYVGIVGVATLLTGALHASKRFVAASFAPAMLNVALIAATLALVPVLERMDVETVYALAVGALVGGLLHVVVQLPSLRKAGLWTRPRLVLSDPDVRRAFALLAPLVLALGVYQLNIIASRQLASFLPKGTITYLFYGQRLVEIPQGMFALAIGSAALPTLSEHAARGDIEKAKALFRRSLSLSLFVALPSTVGLALLAEPFVATLFGRGAYSPEDVVQTARSLVVFAGGIWAVASVRTIVPMFHSLGDTRSPVVASAVNLVVFFSVSLSTMGTLRHVGLALGVSCAAAAQLVVLLWKLRRKTGALGGRTLLRSVGRSFIASALMGVVLYAARMMLPPEQSASLRGTLLLGAMVMLGAVTYGVAALLLRSPELEVVRGVLKRRLGR